MNNIRYLNMKKLSSNHFGFMLFLGILLASGLFTSCNDDDSSDTSALVPVITEVRMYAESPGDSIVSKALPGDWVVLTGKNLKNAVQIAIYGVYVDFNPGLFSDTHAAFQIPSVIPFPSVPENQFNTIRFATANGSVVFPFSVVPGLPSISSISNENPVEGELVTIFGTNLFLTNELVFGGATISGFMETNDGTSISFEMPNSTTSGPLSITTESGTTSTVFHMNNYATEVLCNFDNIGSLSWGTGTSNDDADFPGNHGYYPILDSGILNSGDFSWWNGGRSINIEGAYQWIPETDLGLDVSQFALKFEMNVPGDWNGTSILILKDYNWGYVARYEPWKTSGTNTANFTTGGEWVTVTIPLSEFRTKDGKDGTGDSAPSLTDLLGESGSGGINFFTVNDGDGPTATGFRGAIDNIRVVKITE